MAPIEDIDSGMESPEDSKSIEEILEQDTQKEDDEDTKEFEVVLAEPKIREIEESEDDEPDETLAERLWGLTEMFPESMRNATYSSVVNTKYGIQNVYSFSRSAFWIFFSTSIILFAPVIFEVERAQMEEMQRNQQKQMLLGPNAAMSGGAPPPIMSPPMKL